MTIWLFLSAYYKYVLSNFKCAHGHFGALVHR